MRKIKLWESEENRYVSQYKNKTVDQLKKEKENLTKQIESYSKKTNPTDTETDKNNDDQEKLSAINSVLGTSEISESVEDILVKNTYRKSGYDFRQRLIKNFMKAIESNFDKRYILYTTPIAEDDVPHLEIEVCFDKDSIGKLKYGESFPTICIFHLTYENDKINLYWDNADGRPIKKTDSLDELVDTVVNKIKKEFKKIWDKNLVTESHKTIEYLVYGTTKDGLLGFIDNENLPNNVQPLAARGQYLGDRTYSKKWLEGMYGKGKIATKQDFDDFRIHSKGHLNENNKSKHSLRHNKWD